MVQNGVNCHTVKIKKLFQKWVLSQKTNKWIDLNLMTRLILRDSARNKKCKSIVKPLEYYSNFKFIILEAVSAEMTVEREYYGTWLL